MVATSFPEFYRSVPIITRYYLTFVILLTVAVNVNVVSPLSVYYAWRLVYDKAQFWRLLTTFMFYGKFSLGLVFNLFVLLPRLRYSKALEEDTFAGKPADYFFMLTFGAVIELIAGHFLGMQILSHSLQSYIIYVWSRKNPHVKLSIFGMFSFSAVWFPWVILLFSFLQGDFLPHVLGMAVGHVYFMLVDIYPRMRNGRQLLNTPAFLTNMFRRYAGRQQGGFAPPGAPQAAARAEDDREDDGFQAFSGRANRVSGGGAAPRGRPHAD